MEFVTDNNLLRVAIQTFIDVGIFLLNIILYPLNYIIKTALPVIDSLLASAANIFIVATTYAAWILDAMLIPPTALNIVILYWVFVLSTGWMIFVTKIAIVWLIRIAAIRFIFR